MDSPFVRAGDVTFFDLKTAIGVCTLSYRKSRVRRSIYPFAISIKGLRREVDKFLDYIGDYLNKPEYSVIPPRMPKTAILDPAPSPPPEVVGVAFDAAEGARVSIAEAWNMPIGEAYLAQAMCYRKQGVPVDFINQDEREFQRQLLKAWKK